MTAVLEPVSSVDQSSTPTPRRWTRDEYERLAGAGYFDRQRVLLFRGVILQMPPQGPSHSLAIERFEDFVRKAFPGGHRFRVQMPFHSFDGSEPEPDIAVIIGSSTDKITSHPTTASLIIEVSDTSLRLDREKADVYAGSGVPEYWIVNLVDGTIEVNRNPLADASGGTKYTFLRSFNRSESLSPIASQAVASVNDLLP